MLFRKLIRTAWKYKAQFISMIIMVAIGIGVFTGFNIEWYSIFKDTSDYFEQTKFADYRIYASSGFTAEEAEKIGDIDGVGAVSRVYASTVNVDGGTNTLSLFCLENYDVSVMLVTDGSEYDENSDGIWLSDRYADSNGLKLGDELSLSDGYGNKISGEIVGLIKSSEYLICVADENQLMPDYSIYGFAYVSPKKIFPSAEYAFYPQINIISDLGKADLESKLFATLQKTVLILSKDENFSYAGVQSEIEEGQTMGYVLPVLFLLIGVLTMITTMHRITANEKVQIGTLKALGFKDKRILRHYTSYGFMLGIVGGVLGIGIGFGIAAIILNPNGMMGSYFDIPAWNLYMPWYCWVIIAVTVGLLTLIGFLSVKKMLKGTAADALRPYLPKKMKPLAVEKSKTWTKLSFSTRWNLRDVFRHKSRSLMTLVGIIGCMILLVGGLGMKDTMTEFITVMDDTLYNYETRVNISSSATREEVLSLADSMDADLLASSSVSLNGDAVTLEIYNITHDKIRFVDEKNKPAELGDDGAYICVRLSDDIEVGQTIQISIYGSDEKYPIKIAGIMRSVLTENIVMSSSYADSIGLSYTYGSLFTDIDESEIQSSDIITGTRAKQTVIQTYDSFMEIMNTMVAVLVFAAVILGVVVLYNLGVMSYVERYRELATLKVVGFKDRRIGGILISQNIWLTVIGVLIGLPLGVGVLQLLLLTLGGEYELFMALGALTYTVSILLTFGVSLIVGLFVALKNKKINMVEALKCAE